MRLLAALVFCFVLVMPGVASAHEVYVLTGEQISHALAEPSTNPFTAYRGNEIYFFFWGFIALLTIATLFCMTLFHSFEKRFSDGLCKLKPYAPLVVRLTVGVALISFGYNGALFGPELPLETFMGDRASEAGWLLMGAGALIAAGLFVRAAAVAAAAVALVAVFTHGWYLLNYTTYFVALAVLFVMGSGRWSLERLLAGVPRRKIRPTLMDLATPLAMPVLRIAFGFSIVSAAFYAKFLHSNLALATVLEYNLTSFFQFDPLFVVLGAFIVESLIGLFIMLGLEIRWTTLFLVFWLALSQWYFGEAVWPHIALFGLSAAFFCYGYDKYSTEWHLFRIGKREPVL